MASGFHISKAIKFFFTPHLFLMILNLFITSYLIISCGNGEKLHSFISIDHKQVSEFKEKALLKDESSVTTLKDLNNRYQYSVDIPLPQNISDDIRFRVRLGKLNEAFGNKSMGMNGENTNVFGTGQYPDWDTLKAVVIDDQTQEVTPIEIKARDSKNFFSGDGGSVSNQASGYGGYDVAQAIFGKFDAVLNTTKAQKIKSVISPDPEALTMNILYDTTNGTWFYAFDNTRKAYMTMKFKFKEDVFLSGNKKSTGDGLSFSAHLTDKQILLKDPEISKACWSHAGNNENSPVIKTAKKTGSWLDVVAAIDFDPITTKDENYLQDDSNVPFIMEFEAKSKLNEEGKYGSAKVWTQNLGGTEEEKEKCAAIKQEELGFWDNTFITTVEFSKYQKILLYRKPDECNIPIRFKLSLSESIDGAIRNLAFLRYEPWLVIPKDVLAGKTNKIVRIFFNPESGKTSFTDYPLIEDVALNSIDITKEISFTNPKWLSKYNYLISNNKGIKIFSGNPRTIVKKYFIEPETTESELKIKMARGERTWTTFYMKSDKDGKILSVQSSQFINDKGNKINPFVQASFIIQREDSYAYTNGSESIKASEGTVPIENNSEFIKLIANQNLGIGVTFELQKDAVPSVDSGQYKGSLDVSVDRGYGIETVTVPASLWVHAFNMPEEPHFSTFVPSGPSPLKFKQKKAFFNIDQSEYEAVTDQLLKSYLDRRFVGISEIPGMGCGISGMNEGGDKLWACGYSKIEDISTHPVIGKQFDKWSNPLSNKRFSRFDLFHDAYMLFDTWGANDSTLLACGTGYSWDNEFHARYGDQYEKWEECVYNFHKILRDTTSKYFAPQNLIFYMDEQRNEYFRCQGIKYGEGLDRVWQTYKITKPLGYHYRYTINTSGYYQNLSFQNKVPSGLEVRAPETFRLIDEDLRKCYEGLVDCPIDDPLNLELFTVTRHYNGGSGFFSFIEGATGSNVSIAGFMYTFPYTFMPACGGGKEFCPKGSKNHFSPTVAMEHALISTNDYDCLYEAKKRSKEFEHFAFQDELKNNNGASILKKTKIISKSITFDIEKDKDTRIGPFFVSKGKLSAKLESFNLAKYGFRLVVSKDELSDKDGDYYFVTLKSHSKCPENLKRTRASMRVRYITLSPFIESVKSAYRLKDLSAYMNTQRNVLGKDMDKITGIREEIGFAFDAEHNCEKYKLRCGY